MLVKIKHDLALALLASYFCKQSLSTMSSINAAIFFKTLINTMQIIVQFPLR